METNKNAEKVDEFIAVKEVLDVGKLLKIEEKIKQLSELIKGANGK